MQSGPNWGELSWLGGPALGPMEQWPRNTDGEPLAHIATIQLGEAQALLESPDFTELDRPEPTARLPETGYLEMFHHVGTDVNPEDEGAGGWLVRHVPLTRCANQFCLGRASACLGLWNSLRMLHSRLLSGLKTK